MTKFLFPRLYRMESGHQEKTAFWLSDWGITA